jgi:hypothetical protein
MSKNNKFNAKDVGLHVFLILAILFEIFMVVPVWICGVIDVHGFFDFLGIILTIIIIIVGGSLFAAWVDGDL